MQEQFCLGSAWYLVLFGTVNTKVINWDHMLQEQKEHLSGEDKQGVVLGKEEKEEDLEMDTTFDTSSMFVRVLT